MRTFFYLFVITTILITACSSSERTDSSLSETTDTENLIRDLLEQTKTLAEERQLDSAITIGNLVLDEAVTFYGESDTTVAQAMNILGECYFHKGSFADAESLWLKSLRIRENLLGSNHPDVARSKNNIAVLYIDMGKYSESDHYFEEALSVWESAPDKDELEVAKILTSQTGLYQKLGRYSEAEDTGERSLELKKKMLEPDDISLGFAYNNLSAIYRSQGRYAEAESCQIKAKEIWEKALTPEHMYTGMALANRGMILSDQRKYAAADSFLSQGQEIWEKVLGPEHPYVAMCLNNRGRLYADSGEYKKAEVVLNQALAINRNKMGPEHPNTAESLNHLAYCYTCQGRYEEAESLLKQALSIWEKVYGPEHPFIAEGFKNLARIYGSQGDIMRSLETYSMFLESRQDFIDYVFDSASEGQKIRYLEKYPLVEHSFLSFSLKNNTEETREKVLEMVLRGKAAVFDAVSAEKGVVSCSYDIVQLAQEHSSLNEELSALILAGPGRMKTDSYKARLETIKHQIDLLENDMRKNCLEMKDKLDTKLCTVSDVADILTEDTMLWEFVRYRPYRYETPGSDRERTGMERYLAFTLDHDGNITLTDLGDASEIDSLVSSARKIVDGARGMVDLPLIRDSEKRLTAVTGELHARIFAPLEKLSSVHKKFFISPDGQLNLLPFEILCCSDGKYVIEKYKVSYLSSGRDLVKFRKKSGHTRWALVMSDPEFDFVDERPKDVKQSRSGYDENPGLSPAPSGGIRGCLQVEFTSLPHSRKEAESIIETLRESGGLRIETYQGVNALEEILKTTETPPRVLHLATHGYFCEDLDPDQKKMFENPLVRSGLAFAGANQLIERSELIKKQTGENGILTALEVTGLNLSKTELVILSACDTGVGEVRNGEGVYGLRRAFQYAGAESIVMSLWKVPDKETADLMGDFYKNWLEKGQSKQEALRLSSLKLIEDLREKHNAAHPYLWGGFVFAGDPN